MAWSSIHELRLPQELNVIKINQKPINVVVNQSARSLYHKLSIILFPRRTKCQPSCGRRCFGGRTSSRCHRSGTEISSIRTRWAREFWRTWKLHFFLKSLPMNCNLQLQSHTLGNLWSLQVLNLSITKIDGYKIDRWNAIYNYRVIL